MDRLPRELVDEILRLCVRGTPKNMVLPARLVCREFDHVLKPYICRTLGLEFSRLSKSSSRQRPQTDALQTIGRHCKCLYIDLMVLRDELEVAFLNSVFETLPSMNDFLASLRRKYCMNDASFTEAEYYAAVQTMLFNCREVDSLRLNLPFQLVGTACNAATRILAITLKALAHREEEDSAALKTLVLENVTDVAVLDLWYNPSDVQNIARAFEHLDNLVITVRRQEMAMERAGLFGLFLWNIIRKAGDLQTLSIAEIDHEEPPPSGLRLTRHTQQPVYEFEHRYLPAPMSIMYLNLRRLELKRILVSGDFLEKCAVSTGETLEEMYLTNVYMAVEQNSEWNTDCKRHLWVGVPNMEQPEPSAHGSTQWIAMCLRFYLPKLRVLRATNIGYHVHTSCSDEEHDLSSRTLDLQDPAGHARPLSRRFVEVAMGIEQPPVQGESRPMTFAPPTTIYVGRPHGLSESKPRPRQTRMQDYDTRAYQLVEGNKTSDWGRSIDGIFANCNSNAINELHRIADVACKGMNEINTQRAEEMATAAAAENTATPFPPNV